MVSFSPQAGDRRGLSSFSPGGLCCLGPREERTGLAWNCGLSQWARWWNVVLRGGLDGPDKKVVVSAFAGLWFSHSRAWDCGEGERLMGNSLLRIYLSSKRTSVLAFRVALG